MVCNVCASVCCRQKQAHLYTCARLFLVWTYCHSLLVKVLEAQAIYFWPLALLRSIIWQFCLVLSETLGTDVCFL